MTELFVDTSGWYPLAVANDPSHPAVADALRTAVAQGTRLVTTNLIIAETHVLLLRRIHRGVAVQFLQEIYRPPHLIVSSTPALEATARADWLERFQDQDFSFTDAVSFAVMADRGIRTALALDHHFTTAGFTVIPAT